MGSYTPAPFHSLKSNFCDNEKPCGAAGVPQLLMDAPKGGSKPIFTASFIACCTQAAPSNSVLDPLMLTNTQLVILLNVTAA